jgi:hypothetical protein
MGYYLNNSADKEIEALKRQSVPKLRLVSLRGDSRRYDQ